MNEANKQNAKNLYVLILLTVLGLLVYSKAITGPFIFDDDLLIVKNNFVRSSKHLLDFFYTGTTSGALLSDSNFYRPLQMLSYNLLYQIFDLNSFAFHLYSVLIHIFNSFLVFLLINKLKFPRTASIVGSVIFLIHPVQTEAVSYIAGLADPLGFMFMSLSLLSFIDVYQPKDQKKQKLKIISTVGFYLLALLSKEITLILPLLSLSILVYQWSDCSKEERKFKIKLILSLLGVTAAYLVLRATVLNFTGRIGAWKDSNLYVQSFGLRFQTFLHSLGEYLELLFYPKTLYLERPYRAYATVKTVKSVLGIFLLFGGFAGAIYSLRGKKTWFLSFAWFFIALLPVSGIVPLNAMYLEHWLYFAMPGFCILLAAIYGKLNKNKIFLALIILASLLLGARSIQRNIEWSNPEKFYLNEIGYTLKNNQPAARVFNNLAMVYSNQKNYPKAIETFKQAIKIWDVYPQSHHNLADVYYKNGQTAEAIKEYYEALRLNPQFIYSHSSLVVIYRREKIRQGELDHLEFLKQIGKKQKVSPEAISRTYQSNKRYFK